MDPPAAQKDRADSTGFPREDGQDSGSHRPQPEQQQPEQHGDGEPAPTQSPRRRIAAREGVKNEEHNGGGHPEPPLPKFKDQARLAGFEAALNDGGHPESLPHFKDQAQPAGFEAGVDDGGGEAGGGMSSSIPWAPSVRAVTIGADSEDRNNNPPTLQAAVLPMPLSTADVENNAAAVAPIMSAINNSNNHNVDSMEMPSAVAAGGSDNSQIVLRKNMIWAGAFVVAVLGIAIVVGVVVAVTLNGGDGSAGLPTPQPRLAATAMPTKARVEVTTAPTTLPPIPNTPPITLEPSTNAPMTEPPSTAVPTKIPASLPTSPTDPPISTSVNPNSETKLTASDGAAGDRLGSTLAMDGETIVIGASEQYKDNDSGGRVYVYTRSGTVWTEQAKLTASDGAAGDLFGYSVAINGDTIVIGALSDRSAYVYTLSGIVWTEQAKLTASDGATHDGFGLSVAMYGDTIVIGAQRDFTENGRGSGSAFVYSGSGTVWSEQAKLTASDGAEGDFFGGSVAMDGNTLVIGATWHDSENSGGSAYVYTRSGSFWTEQAKLTASDGSEHESFGFSVAIYGDTIVSGARYGIENGNDSGSAYVYTRSGTVWTEQAKLTASDGAALDLFGYSVAMDGDTIVIGAYFHDTNNSTNSGIAYMFIHSGTAWTEQVKLTASDGAADDGFGQSVLINGKILVIGAEQDDTENGANAGSVYIFE